MKRVINICLLLIVLCFLSAAASAGDIVGEVISTSGDDITVAVKGSKMPKIGWSVDLFYVTSTGKELPVGTWKVQSITGQTITAVKVSGMGNANKKLKAVMHNRQRQQPVASQPEPKPQRAEPVNKRSLPATPNRFESTPAKSSQPIQLLGQTAPDPVAQTKKIRARHILVKTEMEAVWVIAGMKGLSGNQLKEKFMADASELSICPTGKKGGDLGTFGRGRMVAEFDKAVFNMREGTISVTPVKTKYGYHVIYRENELGNFSPAELAPRARKIKNEPTPGDKAAFAEYKKQLEYTSKQVDLGEEISRKARTYWSPSKYWIGIKIADNDRLLGQTFGTVPVGARVLWIASDSPAKRSLKFADIIFEANGVVIQNAEQFKNIVRSATERKMELKIQRNYEVTETTVKLKKLK